MPGRWIGAGKPQHIAVSCLLAHCFDTPGLLGEGSQQGIGHLGNGVELTLLKGGCHHGGVLYNVVLYTIQVRESLNPVVIIPGIYDLGVYLPALKNKGACSHRVYRSPVLSVLLYSNGAISLLTIPQMTANLFTYSFKKIIWLSIGIGFLGCLGGLFISYHWKVPSGASIIFFSILIYAVCKIGKSCCRKKS